MSKDFGSNDDWIAREEGRIPTTGATAAERASAGLGTTDYVAATPVRAPRPRVLTKLVRKTASPDKP